MKTYDLIIIGSGSMGAAGGYYASRSGLRTLLMTRIPRRTTKARTTDKPASIATSTTTTPTSSCSTVPRCSGHNWSTNIMFAC